MKYDKLVRNGVPSIIEAAGQKPRWHIASIEEYESKLRKKFEEEVNEYLSTGDVGEIADVLEVIYALAQMHNVDFSRLEQLRLKKKDKRGGFSRRIILDEVLD